MDDLDRLFEEAENEYPELAMLYNNFMAGEASTDRLKFEYEHGGGVRWILDNADKKFTPIIEDMGFYFE